MELDFQDASRRFAILRNDYYIRISGGIGKIIKKLARALSSSSSSESDGGYLRILISTLDALKDDDARMEFFEVLLGFFHSELMKNLQDHFLFEEFRVKFWPVLNGFLDRTLSSDLVSESVKISQLITCLDAAQKVLGPNNDARIEFLEVLLGFFHSEHMNNFQDHLLFEEFRVKFRPVLNEVLDRTLSSDLVSESVKISQLITCLDATHKVYGRDAVSQILLDILNGQWNALLQSVELANSLGRWSNSVHDQLEFAHYIILRIVAQVVVGVRERDNRWISLTKDQFGVPDRVLRDNIKHGDSALLSVLIHMTRQSFRSGSWTPFVLNTLTQFDMCNTLPELQNEFCSLWNEIVREAWRVGTDSAALNILRETRQSFIGLHHGIDAAPTAFSAHTNYYNPVLMQPLSYRFCNIPPSCHPGHLRILISTLDALRDDDAARIEFFEVLPGLFHSEHVNDLQDNFLFEEFRIKFSSVLNGFLERTVSSGFVSEPDRSTQLLITCLNAAYKALGTDGVSQILFHILNGGSLWGELLQSVEMAHSLRRWNKNTDDEITHYVRRIVHQVIAGVRERDDRWISLAEAEFGVPDRVLRDNIKHGDSALLSLLIHMTRQAFRTGSWTPYILATLTQFDMSNTLSELQHEFCYLWNEIVPEARRGGINCAAVNILREIRHGYLGLHQGTDAFSPHTNFYNPVLAQPWSYPFCDIPSHYSYPTLVISVG